MKKKLLEYKIKNRYLIYMIIFSYCMGSFLGLFVHNVGATTTTELIDFNDFNLNERNLSNSYMYSKIATVAYCNGTYPTDYYFNIKGTGIDGSKNFQFAGSDAPCFKKTTGFFHYKYTNTTSLFLNEWYMYIKNPYIAKTNTFELKNRSTNITIAKFVFGAPSVTIVDYSGSTKYLGNMTAYTLTRYIRFGLRVLSNDSIQYIYNNTWSTYTPTSSGIIALSSDRRIDSLYMSSDTAYLLLDNNTIVLSDSKFYSGSTYTGCDDMSSYYARGLLYTDLSSDSNSRSIYENFIVPLTTNIKGVSLGVNPSQYYDDSNLANYLLTVNDVNIGSASCFYKDTVTHHYILFWNTNIGLNEETLSFNFTHTSPTSYGRYWLVSHGYSGVDLDLDGEATSGEKSFLFQKCSWILLPWFPFPFYQCQDVYSTINNHDLAYQFYFTKPYTTETYNYTDSLGLTGYDRKNATGYIYDINKPNGIICSYTLGSFAYDYTIDLYKNGTLFNTTGFPYNCNYPSGTVGFTPETIGKYTFKLKKVGYVDNITAYVIGSLSNFYIATSPPITNQFESYNILYRFYQQQGLTGNVAMFKSYELINKFTSSDFSSFVDSNETGSLSYYSTSDSSEFWRLFVNRENITYSPVGNVAEHFIRIPGIVDNSISFTPLVMTIKPNNPMNTSVYITGQHNMPGAEVGVYVNGIFYQSVKGSQSFDVFFKPKTYIPTIYTIELKLNQDGILTTLATAPSTLTVNIEGYGIEEEKPLLEAPYSYIAGTILTIVCLILPVIALGKLNIQSEILKYVPIFSGTLGFILSCLIGFFPWYAIFGLILVLVVIIVIVHKSKD